MTLSVPDAHGLDDGEGIAPEELLTARFLLAIAAEHIAEGSAGLRWVAVALRGRRYRELVDRHHGYDYHPRMLADRERTTIASLPPAWHGAWRFGFEWQP